jgi:putative glutamine amidotransferase
VTTPATAPVVGITAYVEQAGFGVWDVPATVIHHAYVEKVAAAGGLPVVIPPIGTPAALVPRLDALIIAGGADVNPARYGAEPHPALGPLRADRDDSEFALVQAALEAGLPLLGICRGLQVLNVALGGTLFQHLPESIGVLDHGPSPGVFGRSTVKVAPGSRLAGLLGTETLTVPCHHHQSIDRLGGGVTPTAWSADGVIEAIEVPAHPFAVGVQWHPEADQGLSLFRALVAAACR